MPMLFLVCTLFFFPTQIIISTREKKNLLYSEDGWQDHLCSSDIFA